MVALDRFPEQRDLWRSDVATHSPFAVEEVFRWASPVRRFRRTALQDTSIAGTPIAAGDKVVLWYMSANRDETVFTDPERFDVTRNPNPHVAFGGGGSHFCLGANLARAEVRALLELLLVRAPGLRVAGSVRYAANDAFNVVDELPMTIGT
jgi:cytochrome P450